MPNSKRKVIVKILVYILLIVLLQEVFAYMLVPGTVYTRLMMHGIYEQEPIDIVFVGASHTYRSFDPNVFDDKLGENTYNVGSSSQTMQGSYYILKEVFRHHSPKKVILEPGYERFLDADTSGLESMILTDYMQWSANRIQFFFDVYALESYPDALFPSLRYKGNLKASTIAATVEKKLSEGYRNFSDDSIRRKTEYYAGKGFVYTEESFGEGHVGKLDFRIWNYDEVSSERVEYFRKIVELCIENGAEPILMTAPIPLATLAQTANYGEAHDYIQKMADQYGIDYYDFNLMRPQVLQRNDDTDYYDAGHMNGAFAEKFSAVAAQLLIDRDNGGVDMGGYFYPTYDALMDELNTVTHVWLTMSETDGGLLLSAQSGHGYNVMPEYCFMWRNADEEEFTVLQNYSSSAKVVLAVKKGQEYVIRVLARPQGTEIPFEQYDEYLYQNK